MSSMRGSGVEWLTLVCPRCQTSFRIKSVYGHLPGRCPECRGWIEAPRPGSRPPSMTADDDLLPIEEEWPEPGQFLEDHTGPTYTFSSPPLDWDTEPPPRPSHPLVETEETYGFAAGHEPEEKAHPERSRTLARAKHEPYGVMPVEPNPPSPVEPDPAMLEPPERPKRQRQYEPLPPPPKRPFVEGLWTFPFRPDNLLALFWLAFSFPLLAVVVTGIVLCANLGSYYILGAVLGAPLALALFFWIGTFAANCFIAVLEETSAGADRITWPTGGLLAEGIAKLFYLLWVGAIAGVIVALPWLLFLNAVGGGLAWVAVAVVPWAIVFPVFLFSSMAASSRFLILEPRTVAAFFKKPQVAMILLLASLVLLGVPLAVTIVALSVPSFLAALGGGVLWSICFLIYARLLGRAGYVLTDGARRRELATDEPDEPR